MVELSRYNVSNEEAGLSGGVLKNKLGVDISKGEMLFVPVQYLSATLEELDRVIGDNTPTISESIAEVAKKLAVIHNESNVVHPFRDGNGRTIRLFLDVVVFTVGFEPINYGDREDYLAGCVAGALKDNEPMQKIIENGLRKRLE
jgi:cell filamentation protein